MSSNILRLLLTEFAKNQTEFYKNDSRQEPQETIIEKTSGDIYKLAPNKCILHGQDLWLEMNIE